MRCMTTGRYRWRTWFRGVAPASLSWLAPKGKRDCGAHEWYRESADTWRCYHCEAGVTHENPWTPSETVRHSLAGLMALTEHPGPESAPEIQRLLREASMALEEQVDEAREVFRMVKEKTGVTVESPLISV